MGELDRQTDRQTEGKTDGHKGFDRLWIIKNSRPSNGIFKNNKNYKAKNLTA